MKTDAPRVEDVERPLSSAELEVLKRQFIKEGEYVTIQTKFNYAWGLVRSADSSQVEQGIVLLVEIYTDEPGRRRECLYFLALAHYKISNYSEARTYNQELLKLEPRNAQAQSLAKQIDEKVSTGTEIGYNDC
ncbi:mitochondria fission 1 protein [Absidia repens]|uniref:Mitochondrial fission 1 protein n=1 Tax=Absidia repens TaxID=90262 RepID=A0A1X2IVQ5_9FUNG|nr:mitochondria fission 1 protein [Absidia repens]